MSNADDTNDLLSSGGSKLKAFRFACRNFLLKFDTKHSNSIFPVAFAAGVVLFSVTLALVIDIIIVAQQPQMHGVVSCDNQQCATVGTQILASGGNAVDAAVATVLCAGVVHPHQSGLGGGGFMIVYNHRTQQTTIYDFRETAPLAVSNVSAYANLTSAQLSDPLGVTRTGGLAISTPGELAGLYAAHSKFGKLSWSQVVTPAAQIAQNGFVVSEELARGLQNEGLARINQSPMLVKQFTRNGALKQAGDTVQLPELAQTLTTIAQYGLQAFYSPTSAIGQSILNAVSKAGGVLAASDLANYTVKQPIPLTGQIGQFRFISMPPPSAGGAFILFAQRVLALLENNNATQTNSTNGNMTGNNLNIFPFINPFNLKTVENHYETLLEVFKYAYANVAAIGDPYSSGNASSSPKSFDSMAYANWLSSDQFAQLVADRIKKGSPGSLSQYDLFAAYSNSSVPGASAAPNGSFSSAALNASANNDNNAGPTLCGEGGGTAHFSVADENELFVAVSSSLNGYFGSCVETSTGIILNNHIDDFTFDARRVFANDVHNAIKPLARPRSCMSPTVLYNPSSLCDLRMACGGAGSQRIPTGLVQTISNVLRLRLQQGTGPITSANLVTIVDNPRLHMTAATMSDNTANNVTNSTYQTGSVTLSNTQQSVEASGNGVMLTLYETLRWSNVSFAKELFNSLNQKGQTVTPTSDALNVVEFAGKVNEQLVGASDPRRGGLSKFV